MGTPPRKEASPPCDPALTGGPRSPPSAWTTSRREDARSPRKQLCPTCLSGTNTRSEAIGFLHFFLLLQGKIGLSGACPCRNFHTAVGVNCHCHSQDSGRVITPHKGPSRVPSWSHPASSHSPTQRALLHQHSVPLKDFRPTDSNRAQPSEAHPSAQPWRLLPVAALSESPSCFKAEQYPITQMDRTLAIQPLLNRYLGQP